MSRAPATPSAGTAFGCPRDFAGNQWVYLVLSPRTGGLSVGINLNPAHECNFECGYCEASRFPAAAGPPVNLDELAAELDATLLLVASGQVALRPLFRQVPPEMLQLSQVSLSGDGEPTLCPQLVDAVQTVVHVRARRRQAFFKLVLVTNGSTLDRPEVQEGLRYLHAEDEVWVKLDAGTQAGFDRVNRSSVTFEQLLHNILLLGRQRPVVIQSLFPTIDGAGPDMWEIEAYAERLRDLKRQGAQVKLVQIYSASPPPHNPRVGHLPLKGLTNIARVVRQVSGLRVEVY